MGVKPHGSEVSQPKSHGPGHRKKDGTSDYQVLDLRGRLRVVRQPSPWSLTATLGEQMKDAILSLLPGK